MSKNKSNSDFTVLSIMLVGLVGGAVFFFFAKTKKLRQDNAAYPTSKVSEGEIHSQKNIQTPLEKVDNTPVSIKGQDPVPANVTNNGE